MIQNKRITVWYQMLALILFVVFCVLLSGCGEKAQKKKVYHIGILSGLHYISNVADGFKAGMTELGYIEGENVIYDMQKTDFDMAMYKSISNKFVEDNVDLIFSFPTEASVEAKIAAQGTGIPVVFCFAFIEDTGLVNSVREPGGDITGVRYPGPDVAVKRFEIMRELVPQAKIMWVPYQRGYPSVASQMEVLHPAAEAAGVTLIEFPADDAAEIKAELDKRAASDDIDIDAILFIAEPLAVTPDVFAVMAKFASEHNVPIGGAYMMVGDYGSIFGVNVNGFNAGKQAAILADKILQGTPAGTIPVVSAETFFQINYNVAKQFGLKVSDGLLSRADEVIR